MCLHQEKATFAHARHHNFKKIVVSFRQSHRGRTTVERWDQVEEIFHKALQRDPGDREAYLREACGGDADLQCEISSLLAHHNEAGDSQGWAARAATQLIDSRVLLHPSQFLGPYRIEGFLAAGGMGEVYRATDTRLNREIAIKVSTARFSQRFETEAKIIAALNHPNICRLYDVGPNYLVMELVEGPTLADTIREGALPIGEALSIARQIAEALEAAHEKGRIHRDLKPGNIKIAPDSVVKLLDFGLADTAESSAAEVSDSASSTLSSTRAGPIMGTPAYMSPEQARGSLVDKRTDIWAFGAVLYEMLAGKPAFAGDTAAEILEAVAGAEPEWSALPASTPARIRKLLRRCLERDRKRRLRDIGEARIVIDSPEEAAEPKRPARQWLVAVGLALMLAIAAVGWWRAAQSPAPRLLMRLSVEVDREITLAKGGIQGALAIAPDGSRLVFVARGADGIQRLATRSFNQSRSTLLAGTENAEGPFFSPDSDWIGFFADGKLKKISIQGGAPVTLCDAPAPRGASWGDDGSIIVAFLTGRPGLTRISSAGGPPTPLKEVNATDEKTNRWPQVLPGSYAVLFNAYQVGDNPDDAEIQVYSFRTGERRTVEHGYFARYIRSGHLVFLRQNTLFAAPFDLNRLAVTATPQPVLDDIGAPAFSGAANFDSSQTGTFVYFSGAAAKRAIFWLDSSGSLRRLHHEPGQYYHPAFSPDGKRLAFTMESGHGMDIWVQNLAEGDASRRSFLPGRNWWPVWASDGKSIVFASTSGDRPDTLYLARADGSGDAQRLSNDGARGIPHSWAADGKWIAFNNGASSVNEIWTAQLQSDPGNPHLGRATRFVDARTPFPDAQFSPDGRWIAYVSAESGIADVFVRPFPGPGGTSQVSIGGGRFPVWSRNGRELFYIGPDKRIRVATYTTSGNSFSVGKSRVWSERQLGDWGVNRMYDLAPDGKRFAVILDTDQSGDSKLATSITVLINFFDELRRRLPMPRK